MKNKTRLLAVLGLGTLIGAQAAQAQYDYQSIDYPGQNSVNIFGINDSGDAAGTAFDPDNISFTYSSMDGTITDLAPASGFATTTALSINDAGVIVGAVTEFDLVTQRAFIRDKQGNYTVFSHPDAVSQTTARGINNKGLVTGTYNTAGGTLAGFVYDSKTGVFTELVPSLLTIAHGINSKGTVAGDARFANDPCGGPVGGQRYGWIRNKDGSVVLFLVNGQRTTARGINDAGTVVGNVVDPFTGQSYGYAIKAPEVSCAQVSVDAADLLQFPGSDVTFPEGITNAGDIIGVYFDNFGNTRGFLATPQ